MHVCLSNYPSEDRFRPDDQLLTDNRAVRSFLAVTRQEIGPRSLPILGRSQSTESGQSKSDLASTCIEKSATARVTTLSGCLLAGAGTRLGRKKWMRHEEAPIQRCTVVGFRVSGMATNASSRRFRICAREKSHCYCNVADMTGILRIRRCDRSYFHREGQAIMHRRNVTYDVYFFRRRGSALN